MAFLKNHKKIVLLAFLVVFCCFCGCETIDNNIAYVKTLMKAPLNLKEDTPKDPVSTQTPEGKGATDRTEAEDTAEITLPTMDELISMNEAQLEGVVGNAQAVTAPGNEVHTVTLYFKGLDSNILVAEKRSVQKVEGIARKTVEELLAGPENGSNISVFPEGTKLKDINIQKNGTCVLDFSKELAKAAGSDKETMYEAITKTLTQFDSVKKIEIRIDGVKVDTLSK